MLFDIKLWQYGSEVPLIRQGNHLELKQNRLAAISDGWRRSQMPPTPRQPVEVLKAKQQSWFWAHALIAVNKTLSFATTVKNITPAVYQEHLVEQIASLCHGPRRTVSHISLTEYKFTSQRKSSCIDFHELSGAYWSPKSTCQPPGKLKFDQNLPL